MTEGLRDRSLDTVVAERWRRLLDQFGVLAVCWRLATHERVEQDLGGSTASQVGLREVFVRADPAQQRTLDLLCVALVERATDGGGAGAHELVVFGPEAIRTQTMPNPSGITVSDLRIGRAGPDLRSVSVILFRVTRRPRVRDIVASIEDLGRVLDYQHDVNGSAAVAQALLRRVEVLAATQGVQVSIAGVAHRSGDPSGGDTHQLLVGRDAAGSLVGHIEVRDGRVVALAPDGGSALWREADFVLVRVGSPPARHGEVRSLHQLRREHALVESGLGPGTASGEESYSSRAARVRQSARAEQIVRLAAAGDAAAARNEYRTALAEPGADGPLAEGLAGRIDTVRDYWLVDAAVREGHDDVPADLRAGADAVGERLGARLDRLLGLVQDSSRSSDSEMFIPVVTPIVFEISDALVPFVDSRQDGGRFLYDLIPAMRDRILAGMGVTVPGVRARGNPNLPPGGFQIQVDEVPAHAGWIEVGASYAILTPEEGVQDQRTDLTNLHPVTGDRGLWLLAVVRDEPDAGAERLTTAEYLIHSIEVVIRAHLTRYLGPQEVLNVVDRWEEQGDQALVMATVPDEDARLRLTWVLQALVGDEVPITDGRRILEAVRDAGGITAPTRSLRQAVRARLRDQLPGPRAGNKVHRVPEELEAALLGRQDLPGVVVPGESRLRFQRWLRETVGLFGPAISLVTGSQDAREVVAGLARSEHRFVTTLSEDERSPA